MENNHINHTDDNTWTFQVPSLLAESFASNHRGYDITRGGSVRNITIDYRDIDRFRCWVDSKLSSRVLGRDAESVRKQVRLAILAMGPRNF